MRYQDNRTWLEIDLNAIKQNYVNIEKKLAKNCEIIAVIKANAYGLGAVELGRVFEALHCPVLAVATVEEAMELRENGIRADILILGPIHPKHAVLAVENNFHVTFADLHHGKVLSDIIAPTGRKLKGHIKIDSGLSRLGIVVRGREERAQAEIRDILSLPGLDTVGVYTHTSNSSSGEHNELERRELELFASIVPRLKQSKPDIKAHCLSSSTLSSFSEYSYDFVRIGVLYMGTKPELSDLFDVSQAVSLKSRVIQKKAIPEGTCVSYDATFTTSRPTTIAIVPIGYADGLRRSVSNRASMLLHGCRAPIIGKICCDYSILDITDIPDAAEGDIVTIFGKDNGTEQYAYHYAELYPASVSEVTATLTSRIPRFYLKNDTLAVNN